MHEHLGLCCVDDTKRVLPFKVFETQLSWPAALGRRNNFAECWKGYCISLGRLLLAQWQGHAMWTIPCWSLERYYFNKVTCAICYTTFTIVWDTNCTIQLRFIMESIEWIAKMLNFHASLAFDGKCHILGANIVVKRNRIINSTPF